MDALSNKELSESKQNESFVVNLSSILGFFLWVIGLDTLTKKERKDAGVNLSGEGRDEE
jgi:hypothetical protein